MVGIPTRNEIGRASCRERVWVRELLAEELKKVDVGPFREGLEVELEQAVDVLAPRTRRQHELVLAERRLEHAVAVFLRDPHGTTRCRRDARRLVTPFFFQAEDGIRGDLVTGVQTCALPISLRNS